MLCLRLGQIKAARFMCIAAEIPIGIMQDICLGLEKDFNSIIMKYKSPQRITQLEKRLVFM